MIKDCRGIYFLHFEGFLFKYLSDFLENALTLSVFEQEKCSLHKSGIEFENKDNGTMIVGLMQH